MADKNAQIRERFVHLFKMALARGESARHDKATIRKMEHDYEELKLFVNKLNKVDQIDACLEKYLAIYSNYFPSDRRSKFIFALLLHHRIDATKVGDRYIDDVSQILADNTRPFQSPLRSRFEDLEDREKREIQSSLKHKKQSKKQRSTVLDELKNAYYDVHKREGTVADLLEFNPVPDAELEKEFNALRKNLRDEWESNSAARIDEPLKHFMTFVYRQKDCLRVFQIIKWCRDIVRGKPRIFVAARLEKYKTVADDLDRELYFQSVYWLFRHSLDHGYSHTYKSGFSPNELEILFAPLAPHYYYQNWLNRYEAATTKADKYSESSILFVRLLIFGRLNNAVMANNQEALKVKNILDTTPRDDLKKKSFKLDVGREIFRGTKRIGSNAGQVTLKYFDQISSNPLSQDLYVEFVGLANLYFRISKSMLATFYENSFYTELWKNTRHLLRLIPAMFALLGYTFSFVTGGLSALVSDVVLDVGIGKIADEADLGTKGTVALGLLSSLAVGRVVGPPKTKISGAGVIEPEGFERALNRDLGSIAEDMKASRRAEKLLDVEARAIDPASRMTSKSEALDIDEYLLGGKETLTNIKARGTGKVQKKGKAYIASATNDAVSNSKVSNVAAYDRGTSTLPGPLEDFPFAGGSQPLPKPEVPDRLFRIMSVEEAIQTLKTGEIQFKVFGTSAHKYFSLDSKYVMLFHEETIDKLAKRGLKNIKSQTKSLKSLEARIEKASRIDPGEAAQLRGELKDLQAEIEKFKNEIKADAGPVIQDWFAAPGQKVVLEIELAPGTIENMLKRAVDEKLIPKYQGKDVFIWKFERNYGRNLAVPPWQLDAFNESVVNIRMIAERGLNLFGATRTPPIGTN